MGAVLRTAVRTIAALLLVTMATCFMVNLLPGSPGGVVVASGVSAGIGVVLASLAFTLEYAIGGTGGASVTTVGGAMVGVHALIGIGEGVITAMTVSAVLASRPDLVWGARDLRAGAPAAEPALARGVT